MMQACARLSGAWTSALLRQPIRDHLMLTGGSSGVIHEHSRPPGVALETADDAHGVGRVAFAGVAAERIGGFWLLLR